MAVTSLRDALRWFFGRGKKPRSPFASEKEAYEFCKGVFEETNGVTPELRRAFEYYKQHVDDECLPHPR